MYKPGVRSNAQMMTKRLIIGQILGKHGRVHTRTQYIKVIVGFDCMKMLSILPLCYLQILIQLGTVSGLVFISPVVVSKTPSEIRIPGSSSQCSRRRLRIKADFISQLENKCSIDRAHHRLL